MDSPMKQTVNCNLWETTESKNIHLLNHTVITHTHIWILDILHVYIRFFIFAKVFVGKNGMITDTINL